MKIFVTGASGWVGSAVTRDLIANGHRVLGLARSDASAEAVVAAGAEVLRGSLDDLDSLRRGAGACDGVIHTAFVHDFASFAANCAIDQTAIEAIGEVLSGSGRPLIVTSGTLGLPPGRLGTEDDPVASTLPRKSEPAALALVARGVRAMVVRLAPSVHGDGDHGFISILVRTARAQGASAYVGDGANRWPAVHRFDAARIYRLALETGTAGSRFHGVADEGIPVRAIAEAIGRRLNLPTVSKTAEEAGALLGFIGHVLAMDGPASSALTRERLGWQSSGPGLLADLERGRYFDA